MIRIENLNKSFGNNHVLKDINMQLSTGKVYGVVGKNGAGKTTLFRCLSGLEKFDGTIKHKFSLLKNVTGFLETNPFFMKRMTAKEYLQLHYNARGIESDVQEQNIFDLPMNEYVLNFSTGMKKKLALNAILIQKNEFFILDEPYSGVDLQSNIIIEDIINSLKAKGKTIIISSHILSSLKSLCDSISLLSEGKIKDYIGSSSFDDLERKMKEDVLSMENKNFEF